MVPEPGAEPSAAVLAAEEAKDKANDDPAAAQRLARRVLAHASDDAWAQSLAHEALGVAAQHQQDLEAAVDLHRQAVAIASDASLAERAAQARMSLCHALLSRGEPAAALREVDRAAAVLAGSDRAAVLLRRALVLQRLGRLDESLEAYDAALPLLQQSGDQMWEARLLSNRGVLHVYRAAFAAAERDLLRAEQLHTDLEQTLASAQVRHNLGFLNARRGDVPRALQCFDAAARTYARLGITDFIGLADRCELLISARLLDEAEELATQAVTELDRARMDSDLAEARLTLAHVKLLLGNTDAARSTARDAEKQFVAQDRAPWVVLAGYVILRADWHAGQRDQAFVRRADRTARELAANGWVTAAADARLIAARSALELDDRSTAEEQLQAARAARYRGPVELRSRAWHAEALLRLAHGNRRGADAALRAGMRALERHRATLGATELRVHLAGHGSELARLGTRLAVESADAKRVLRWAERWRAGTLFLRPVRPPDDEELVAELAALRHTVAEVQAAAVAGRDTASLLSRQARLERSIQLRSRHAPGSPQEIDSRFSLETLGTRLGPRALVELVRLEDQLWAVVVVDGDVRLRRLGSHERATNELDHLRFALTRLAMVRRAEPGQGHVHRSASYAAEQLDGELLAPVLGDVGDRPLVIVPTGALHAVPWTILPSCAGRAVTVAPSANVWCGAMGRTQRPADGGDVALVGCTEPAHAIGEVEAISQRYPTATVLVGADATVAAVTASLERASVAHLACHGNFRKDNPLFSCLELEDGPLTVQDLERHRSTPPLLLLSACDSGLSAVHPGDELMGLSSALFALGTATLIASVVPVSDWATRRMMVGLHDELSAGQDPAVALAGARSALDEEGYWGAAAGFACFGAGWSATGS